MRKILPGSIAIVMALLLSTVTVGAQGVWDICNSASSSAVCADDSRADSMVANVVSTLLVVLGSIAVIMIIWSGYKFVISRGDPANIKSAKDTLLYAIIGLVIAVLSYAIVRIVLKTAEGN
jgi:bacteriorhodopsin